MILSNVIQGWALMAKNLLDIGFLTIYIGLLSIGVMAYTTLHLKLALTQ